MSKLAPQIEPIAVRVSTAAAMVDLNKLTIYKAIWSGQLPAYRAHEKAEMRVLISDLYAWVQGQVVPRTRPAALQPTGVQSASQSRTAT